MNMKLVLVLLATIFVVGISSATVATDIISTNASTWTAPSGVFTTTVQAIGGGAAGNGGVIVVQWFSDTTNYFTVPVAGPGGSSGTSMTWNNVAVVPGNSYTCLIGNPGASISGYSPQQFFNTPTVVSLPAVSYTAGNGKSTSVSIGGTQYSAAGGTVNNITISTCGYDCPPTISYGGTSSSSGALGILSSLYFAISGTSTGYGAGGVAGYGYGGGGGGGGPGGVISYANFASGGAGGAGGQGAIAFTYNTNSVAFYPYGYVTDQFGTPISGASVVISNLGINQGTYTSGDGYYYAIQPLTTGFPVNITASVTGYTTEEISFTPQIATSVQINLTLVNPSAIISNGTSIYGITHLAPYYQPYGGAIYHAYNATTSENYTNITTSTGYGQNGLLTPNQNYQVWSSASGMNSTIYEVVAVGT